MNRQHVGIPIDTIKDIFRRSGGQIKGVKVPNRFCTGYQLGLYLKLGQYELITTSNVGDALVEFFTSINTGENVGKASPIGDGNRRK